MFAITSNAYLEFKVSLPVVAELVVGLVVGLVVELAVVVEEQQFDESEQMYNAIYFKRKK